MHSRASAKMSRACCPRRRGTGTYRFADRARAAGVEVELVAVPYADHVFDARHGSIGQQAYRQVTARWLRDHGQGP
jgi:acetyl esterase